MDRFKSINLFVHEDRFDEFGPDKSTSNKLLSRRSARRILKSELKTEIAEDLNEDCSGDVDIWYCDCGYCLGYDYETDDPRYGYEVFTNWNSKNIISFL